MVYSFKVKDILKKGNLRNLEKALKDLEKFGGEGCAHPHLSIEFLCDGEKGEKDTCIVYTFEPKCKHISWNYFNASGENKESKQLRDIMYNFAKRLGYKGYVKTDFDQGQDLF